MALLMGAGRTDAEVADPVLQIPPLTLRRGAPSPRHRRARPDKKPVLQDFALESKSSEHVLFSHQSEIKQLRTQKTL
jgi:hypothetical protein